MAPCHQMVLCPQLFQGGGDFLCVGLNSSRFLERQRHVIEKYALLWSSVLVLCPCTEISGSQGSFGVLGMEGLGTGGIFV